MAQWTNVFEVVYFLERTKFQMFTFQNLFKIEKNAFIKEWYPPSTKIQIKRQYSKFEQNILLMETAIIGSFYQNLIFKRHAV